MVRKIIFTAVVLSMSSMAAYATDFSQYSNEELMNMKSEARTWDSDKHDAFKTEMQSRMQSMSQEERQALRGSSGSNGQRLRDGSGQGKGQGGGQGMGRF